MKEGQVFCTNCGATVTYPESDLIEPNKTQLESAPVQRSSAKSALFLKSWKFKIIVIVLVILAMGGFTGYKIVDSQNHPAKIVQQFEKAVDQRNTKELARLLNSGQDEMDVSETDANMLLAFFKDHPDILADTMASFKRDANVLDDGGKVIFNGKNGVFLNLIETKKKWLIFSQYGIGFKAVYLKVSSNQAKTEITVDNNKLGELMGKEVKTFGPFLPVEHEVTGAYNGQYGTARISETIYPAEYEDRKIAVELDVSGNRGQTPFQL